MSIHSKLGSFPFVLLAIAPVTGCVMNVGGPYDDPEYETLGSVNRGPENPAMAIQLPNGLKPEALDALDAAALGARPLDFDLMAPVTIAEITASGPYGELARLFLKYAIGCALGPEDQFGFSFTDSGGALQQVTFVGSGGLAPDWRERPLAESEQQWVSACLAARTNWYGRIVPISLRGNSPELVPSAEEIQLYPSREGAFWGNLFAPEPFLRSCYVGKNASYSRSLTRECAAGHLAKGARQNCGIIEIVGPCSASCTGAENTDYYSRCGGLQQAPLAANTQTPYVITVFLQ